MANANPNSDRGAAKDLDLSRDDCLKMLDKVVRATDALHYLNTLLDIAINASPECLADIHSGLAQLMGRQIEDIGDVVDPLRAYVKRDEADPITRHSPPEGWITPPVYDANSLRAEIAAEKAAAEIEAAEAAAVARLRRMDLEAVARDTKLTEDTVRRVVDRLMAEPSEIPGPVALNG